MATKLTSAEAADLIRQLARDLIVEELADIYDIIENGVKNPDPEDPTFQTFLRTPLSASEREAAHLEVTVRQSDLERIAGMTDQEVLDYLDTNFDMTEGDILSAALIA